MISLLKPSKSYRVFSILNLIFLITLAALCILPILNVLAISLSETSAVKANRVFLWPVGFNAENYAYILENRQFLDSMRISILRVIVGTALSMFINVITAYPLSHSNREFKGRNLITWLFIFPMLFSGGLIPTALLYFNINIYNTFWVLILPSAVQTMNVILMVNYFKGLPKSLQESAKLDGASHWVILFRIYLPLSAASLSTLSLFCAVGHWNSWFDGLVFIDDAALRPLQSLLKSLLNELSGASKKMLTVSDVQRLAYINDRSLVSAQIFVGMLPILLVYPFVQRYFITGITIGAVKE